ncbi:MAG: tRNA (adenosine(37)-N6)-threonylcarbamoyltransferase complex ATPase subunit type 1 TsaE [Oscillospiraceae bacterium]|jgi:tRNA threonylcarbamoyladenosine biosynthesis protein TsaE|nr:tRNA (adenosine(37)-N6)-threonylcarbamoyltransferase complex ATPase subunit type 1 TsaE [Oscillospiraceae bacterium]
MIIYSGGEVDTERAGRELAARLYPGAVVALRGGLGAGKTVFTRGLARGLGVTARVVSPTFNIVNEYDGRLPLFHFDMYRISGAEELFGIGFEEYLDRGGVVCVEWSELAADALPPNAIGVTIELTGDNTRKITIED